MIVYRTINFVLWLFFVLPIFFATSLEDEIKIKNKIHLDHFPIELKSKESNLIQLENGPNEFYFYFYQLKWQYLTRCCHWG